MKRKFCKGMSRFLVSVMLICAIGGCSSREGVDSQGEQNDTLGNEMASSETEETDGNTVNDREGELEL